MDKVLAFSILSASPAEIAAGADATGGSWAGLSWRGKKRDDQSQAAEAEQQLGSGKSQSQPQLGSGKSQSQPQLPRREEEARRPRFAPEFDGIDCFETIIWR